MAEAKKTKATTHMIPMHWDNYREHPGRVLEEVVLVHHPADLGHPFLKRRAAQYREDGKVVVLLPWGQRLEPLRD